jgi:hypothetical protein
VDAARAACQLIRKRSRAVTPRAEKARTLLVRIVQMTTGLEQAMLQRKGRLSAAVRTAG